MLFALIWFFLLFFTVQADAEFQARLLARGFSDNDISEKDRPSEIISSLENAVSDTVKT